MIQRQDVSYSGTENLIAFEWVGCLAAMEVLHPSKDKDGKLWDRDFALPRVVELVKVS